MWPWKIGQGTKVGGRDGAHPRFGDDGLNGFLVGNKLKVILVSEVLMYTIGHKNVLKAIVVKVGEDGRHVHPGFRQADRLV